MNINTVFILVCCSLVGHLGSCNVLRSQDDNLPKGWSAICTSTIKNNTSSPLIMKCQPSPMDLAQWSMDDLRQWATNRTSNLTYVYDVRCKHGGNISLPWPMKALGMVGLHVHGCNILDIFDDFGNTAVESLPDELKVMDIRHSVIKIRISSMLSTVKQIRNISSDYNCGHDSSLESITFRNVSYKLDYSGMRSFFAKLSPVKSSNSYGEESSNSSGTDQTSSNSSSTNSTSSTKPRPTSPLLDFTDMLEGMLNTQTQCQYDNLKYLEESISDTLSVFHYQFLVKGSRYPSLQYLNYSYNHITLVPEPLLNWRLYFPNLKNLDLSHNYISEAYFKYFPTRLSEVTYINLRFNNITTPKVNEIVKWAKIPKLLIDIRNNPVHCGCGIAEFVNFLRNKTFFHNKGLAYNYIKTMLCASPDDMLGKVLGTLDPSSLPCPKYSNLLIPLISVGILALFLFILLVLAVRFRREIRILFFTRFHILLPGDVADLERNKRYDAFVSYSNEDDDWVLGTLCSKLESIKIPRRPDEDKSQSKQNNFPVPSTKNCDHNQQNGVLANSMGNTEGQTLRLCLHHRDFVPGLSILDNILNSIEASRHTIVVLSRNFVKSEWALEEFRQAYQQSIVERRRHLIILVYEHIPAQDMDPLLKRCFKMFTYLDVTDRLFWDRIVYSLSTKQKLPKEKKNKQKGTKLAYTSVFDISHDVKRQNLAMRQLSTSSTLSDVTVTSEERDVAQREIV